MCRDCWRQVPKPLQDAVYDTVGLRGAHVDASWAPWWRAQARAISHVAFLSHPDEAKRDRYLDRELRFADSLEAGDDDAE